MNLVPWNPFREWENISREMSDLFSFPTRVFGGFASPRVDVYQTENDLVVEAEIPGVSKEDLELYIDENTVRLAGRTKRENGVKDETVCRKQRYYGSFSRVIPLPVEVKSDQAKAEYKDGVLSVTMPKVEPAKAKIRKIDIQ